jgi:hypothetical protein
MIAVSKVCVRKFQNAPASLCCSPEILAGAFSARLDVERQLVQ